MYVWLTVEDDGQGRAVRSYMTGGKTIRGESMEPVPRGAEFHQDLSEAGWRPVWVRDGKSVWRAVGNPEQALSDYWLLVETKGLNKEV